MQQVSEKIISNLIRKNYKVCAIFAGLMSGLTVGLLSIDKLELEIKLVIGSKEEQRCVSKKCKIWINIWKYRQKIWCH